MNLQSIKQRFGIIGNSATLNHALKTAVQIAPTDLTVLIGHLHLVQSKPLDVYRHL